MRIYDICTSARLVGLCIISYVFCQNSAWHIWCLWKLWDFHHKFSGLCNECPYHIEYVEAVAEMFPSWPGGGPTAQLPLQKASLSDLWPRVCPLSFITPSYLSPSPQPVQAWLTEIDWSACWIFDQWVFPKPLPCETESFDRIFQPGSLGPLQMRVWFAGLCFLFVVF